MTDYQFERHIVCSEDTIDMSPSAEIIRTDVENGALIIWTRTQQYDPLPADMTTDDQGGDHE